MIIYFTTYFIGQNDNQSFLKYKYIARKCNHDKN